MKKNAFQILKNISDINQINMTSLERKKFQALTYQEQEYYLSLKGEGKHLIIDSIPKMYKDWLINQQVSNYYIPKNNDFVLCTKNQNVIDAYNKMINPVAND